MVDERAEPVEIAIVDVAGEAIADRAEHVDEQILGRRRASCCREASTSRTVPEPVIKRIRSSAPDSPVGRPAMFESALTTASPQSV